jgi:hypothetical protein
MPLHSSVEEHVECDSAERCSGTMNKVQLYSSGVLHYVMVISRLKLVGENVFLHA